MDTDLTKRPLYLHRSAHDRGPDTTQETERIQEHLPFLWPEAHIEKVEPLQREDVTLEVETLQIDLHPVTNIEEDIHPLKMIPASSIKQEKIDPAIWQASEGSPLSVLTSKEGSRFRARCVGLDGTIVASLANDGRLLIRLPDGTTHIVWDNQESAFTFPNISKNGTILAEQKHVGLFLRTPDGRNYTISNQTAFNTVEASSISDDNVILCHSGNKQRPIIFHPDGNTYLFKTAITSKTYGTRIGPDGTIIAGLLEEQSDGIILRSPNGNARIYRTARDRPFHHPSFTSNGTAFAVRGNDIYMFHQDGTVQRIKDPEKKYLKNLTIYSSGTIVVEQNVGSGALLAQTANGDTYKMKDPEGKTCFIVGPTIQGDLITTTEEGYLLKAPSRSHEESPITPNSIPRRQF